VGNPFACNAYIGRTYYRINTDGNGFVSANASEAIKPCEGVFVVAANADDNNVTFSRTSGSKGQDLVLNMVKNRGNVIDNVRLCFGEGQMMSKLMLNADNSKLYIQRDNKEYAVVLSDAQGEMPVNMKAGENGTYTISVSNENIKFNYLHLIDNMTGTDVDLLVNPSYTFDAKTTDYESRFKLVFAASDMNSEAEADEPFAFYSNGVWVINNEGDATLQVVDVLGHVLSSERISGATTKAIHAASGIYMLRLINGDNVKVQKVVVR
jgi:hypothetical protein